MKIAFVWYWDKASEIYPNWRDGLRAAMEEIGRKHTVTWFFDKNVPSPTEEWDAIIFWDDSNSLFFAQLDQYTCKKALCLTTDPANFDNLRKLDCVFCESQPILDQVRAHGIRAILAFGTDTTFFAPDPSIEKDIEYFYPATFSPWKRQSDLAYLGGRLVCVGTVQPDGVSEYKAVRAAGAEVYEGYFPVAKIREFYNRTKAMKIPAIHGSERTVLEAMSMNIVPEIVYPMENRRAHSYIKEYRGSTIKTPREFVLKRYSHKVYARNILKGIS